MNEIIEGISYKEYLLTLMRIVTFLNTLGSDHKKATTQERLVYYDFFLKYPELIEEEANIDFDTKYSYFHWKPNYRLYAAVLTDAHARLLIELDKKTNRYKITELGTSFVENIPNNYVDMVSSTSKYVIKNICSLSNKAINEKINYILLDSRGLIN